MPLLSRNPFHNNSSTHLHSSNSHDKNNEHTHNHQPPLRRSSRSFLSFMSRKPSMESIRSDKSNDSVVMNSTTPNHHHYTTQVHTNNTGNTHTNSGNSSPHHHSNQHHASHSQPHHDIHHPMTPKPSHSMAELKRFFRSSKKVSTSNLHSSTTLSSQTHHQATQTHPHSPTNHHPYSTTTLNLNAHYQNPNNGAHSHAHPHGALDHHGHTQSAIPPSSDSILSLSNNINIYHDDAILAQKYGKLGKTLGSGAGGSVKILVRPTDKKTFAVKEFRPRKNNESIKQYAKKCTAEFCIGSSLHHPNIVQTIDIFSDFNQSKYFEVMEYLPVDFFAVVMTGLMSRGEVNCCFKQLCRGVRYLHSMGLAHRDLKLDNCVMNEQGILKLIDFGSAAVFRYPFENDITMAHGIVGSDPYLAPEVITSTKSYDPQFVDIWSMGIIFCCMMLKRFPWKAPKSTDDNFKLYSMPDDFPHDYNQSAKHHEELLKERRQQRNDHDKKLNHIPTPPKEENHQSEEKDKEEHVDVTEDKKDEGKDTIPPPKIKEIEEVKKIAETANERNEPINNDNHNDKITIAPCKPIDNDAQDLKSIASNKTAVTTSSINNRQGGPHHHHKKVIHGPYRLLRLLPHASRPIMSKILEIDPNKRATLIDIFDDDWFDSIPACTIDIKNKVVREPGHHHTIVKDDKTYKI